MSSLPPASKKASATAGIKMATSSSAVNRRSAFKQTKQSSSFESGVTTRSSGSLQDIIKVRDKSMSDWLKRSTERLASLPEYLVRTGSLKSRRIFGESSRSSALLSQGSVENLLRYHSLRYNEKPKFARLQPKRELQITDSTDAFNEEDETIQVGNSKEGILSGTQRKPPTGLNDDLPLHRHGKDNIYPSEKDNIKMSFSEKDNIKMRQNDKIKMRHCDNEPASYVLQSGCYLWPGRTFSKDSYIMRRREHTIPKTSYNREEKKEEKLLQKKEKLEEEKDKNWQSENQNKKELMYGKFSYADTTYEPPNYKDLNFSRDNGKAENLYEEPDLAITKPDSINLTKPIQKLQESPNMTNLRKPPPRMKPPDLPVESRSLGSDVPKLRSSPKPNLIKPEDNLDNESRTTQSNKTLAESKINDRFDNTAAENSEIDVAGENSEYSYNIAIDHFKISNNVPREEDSKNIASEKNCYNNSGEIFTDHNNITNKGSKNCICIIGESSNNITQSENLVDCNTHNIGFKDCDKDCSPSVPGLLGLPGMSRDCYNNPGEKSKERSNTPGEKSKDHTNIPGLKSKDCSPSLPGLATITSDYYSSSTAEGEYEFLEDSDGYLKPNGRFQIKKPQSNEKTTSNDEHLIRRMEEKVSALEVKKVNIEGRNKENELVGMDIETELSLYASKKELNLFRVHIQELASVSCLLLGLAGRLAKVETSLEDAVQEGHPTVLLRNKRDALLQQIQEARWIKSNIDKRSCKVEKLVEKYLETSGIELYNKFVCERVSLSTEKKEIEEKLQLGRRELRKLQTF